MRTMRNIFCAFLFLLVSISAYGENVSSQWAVTLHVASVSWMSSIEQTFDGGFLAAGEQQGNGPWGPLLVRLGSSGNVEWAKTYYEGGPKNASLSMAIQTSDGGFVFAGSKGNDALAIKLDPSGNIVWQKAYGSSSSILVSGTRIVQAADGGFFFLGRSIKQLPLAPQGDVLCLKLKSDGSILWQRGYGGGEYADASANSAIATPDGGLVFAGSMFVDTMGLRPWVVRLDARGGIRWQILYDLKNDDWSPEASTIEATADGGYIVAGSSGGFERGWVLKLKADGTLSWRTGFDYGQMFGRLSSIREEKDGHVLVTGEVGTITRVGLFGTIFEPRVLWTARLDSNGKMFWRTGFGKTGAHWFNQVLAIHETSSDGTIFTGDMQRSGEDVSSVQDSFVAQIPSKGTVCTAFRKSVKISSHEPSVTVEQAEGGVKKTDVVMRTTHFKQAAVSVKIRDLCANK